MSKIIGFAASNSKNSINKALVEFVLNTFRGQETNCLDLNDYALPLYSIDIENESGIPTNAKNFREELQSADALVISMAEHNSNWTAAFKNLYDWMSRIEKNVFPSCPMFLLSASPGGRAGISSFELAKDNFTRKGAHIVAEFNLPFFQKNFSATGIADPQLAKELQDQLHTFTAAL